MITYLIKIIFTLLLTGIFTTLSGYFVHWLFHQYWTMWFYESHMNHHKIQYPPTDFFSEKYRGAGKNSTVLLFMIASIPIFILIVGMVVFGIISIKFGIITSVGLIGWALLHNYLHDQFHIKNSFWKKFNIFNKWCKLHFVHHLDMKLNFGILFFVWDRLFKTYDNGSNLNLDN